MTSKIVLVSDDLNFFEFIKAKLELRKSDELLMLNFDSVPEQLSEIETAVLIINTENSQEKTLDLLNLLKNTPVIAFAFNDDDVFRRKCYRAGVLDFMTLLTQDAEFRARMIPALSISTLLNKNKQYRKYLESKNIILNENEVFQDYNYIIDLELKKIKSKQEKAIFGAISPNDNNKFLLKPALIETIILNNIRQNDILMNFAPNKYFILLFDLDIKSAKKLWEKINSQLPQKIHAGFCNVLNQSREILINEALNKLHEDINHNRGELVNTHNPLKGLNTIQTDSSSLYNFKQFRQEFDKKIEQIITPVFYQIQQKYTGKFMGVTLEQYSGDGYGIFHIKEKHASSCFKITSPGFSKINIDMTYQNGEQSIDAKRITLEPEELEQGLLEDLLEQFILEFKRGYKDAY